MKKTILILLTLFCLLPVGAQRVMEKLDRGLVAVKVTGGVYTSWRILGEEYYDTQYNLYRDGVKVNAEPLDVSNYRDAAGTLSSSYTVRAVVRGVEQADSKVATVWSRQYHSIPMGRVYSRRGTDITANYGINDVSTADLDGDGEFEFIVKRVNNNDYDDRGAYMPENDSAFVFFEAYDTDGTQLWQIDCGPNMVSGSDVEVNLIAYDWDGDGKAELLMRAADGTILPGGVVIGDITKNYRNLISHSANMTYMTAGDEFLLYMEGATAKLYNQRPFPLKRLEAGETDLNAAWGDGYGHRSSKYFFGAPYLDGRKPSIFLARGIYTRHKMIAYDVDPVTHELIERWRWNDPGGAWFGQGYHNYGIADVDWDGRDEIVYGSMIIDDNGKGLSTTGLGHGDAQHCSDLDPYRKGQEIFACNENAQGANYRDATTSRIYYMHKLGRDCGRAMAGNFTNDYAGSQMVATGMGLLSSVTNEMAASGYSGITQNFRIYWDGDLCEESFDGTGNDAPGAVFKYGQDAPIFTAEGTKTCNWTKKTPSLQADVLGDWREEIVLRSTDDMELRIYTTTASTPWRNYTLMHDMQYRQAICWQMCGYNQPPHTGYFLGEAEGITVAPPPFTTSGREEVSTAITTAHNGKHILLAHTDGGEVTVAEGASPYILTVNAFSHTTGSNNNDNIRTTQSVYTLKGGTFAGAMRLVKQGEGILNLSGDHAYTGRTDLWAGVTNLNGSFTASPVWMNRFAELNIAGHLGGGLKADYGSILRPGGRETKGTVRMARATFNFGAIVEFDLYSDLTADCLAVDGELTLGTSPFAEHGPEYDAPVFRFVQPDAEGASRPAPGRYLLAEAASIVGDVSTIRLEGLEGVSCKLVQEEGKIYLEVLDMRAPTTVYWDGSAENGLWDLNCTPNMSNAGVSDIFVTGDDVVFDDAAKNFNVTMAGAVEPASVSFPGSAGYFLKGEGGIAGAATFTKTGTGRLTINNVNPYTGKTTLAGGTTLVSSLGYEQAPDGALGTYTTTTGKFEMKSGAVLQTTKAVTLGTPLRVGEGGATLNCGNTFDAKGALSGDTLTKTGTGALNIYANGTLKALVLKAGTLGIATDGVTPSATLVLEGGTYQDHNNMSSYSTNRVNFVVPRSKTATLNLDSRCTYQGTLEGEGTVNVDVPNVRVQLQGDWSAFKGMVKPTNTTYGLTLDNSYGLPNATLNIPAGVHVSNTAKTYRIGKLTGTGTLGGANSFSSAAPSGSNHWQVGSADGEFTFGGKITGTGTQFTKIGEGTMKVTGASDFTGICTVSKGTLCLNKANATVAMMGTGALVVKSGATLSGQGLLGNSVVRVESGGTLRPGVTETSMSGTIDLGGKNLLAQAGSTVRFFVRTATLHTKLTNVGTLTLQGTLKVDTYEGADLPEGTELCLWTAGTYNTASAPKLELGSPGEGKEWDTSDLDKGILRVVVPTGITSVPADEEVACTVCTLDGVKVADFVCANRNISHTLNATSLLAGVYVVKAVGTTNRGSAKFIKH